MANDKPENPQKTCFVVMGFGKKTDFETGRVLDLDKSYKNMIKPAVEAAGLKCIRADEIVHSGLIDIPMYEQLLNADVVVADLSTSNKNAFYELGVRHALRPFTTVIICEDGIKAFPFDINHVAVRQYHHLGEDIGYEEVVRFKEQLTNAIKEITSKEPRDKDSPVYSFLNGLTPPEITVLQSIQEASVKNNADTVSLTDPKITREPSSSNNETHSLLMHQVDSAQKEGDWVKAKTILTAIRQIKQTEIQKQPTTTVNGLASQEDPYILQRLALTTYKSEQPSKEEALKEAYQILVLQDPQTSNDTETLGLWGTINKKLFEITHSMNYLDEAARAYERGFFLRNDYYNGINFAFLLNVRSGQQTSRAEAIADFIEARRIRKEVLDICNQWLQKNQFLQDGQVLENIPAECLKTWYWVKATMGEAYLGTEENEKAEKELQQAYSKVPEAWMKKTTEEQVAKLRLLLANSPLKYIQE